MRLRFVFFTSSSKNFGCSMNIGLSSITISSRSGVEYEHLTNCYFLSLSGVHNPLQILSHYILLRLGFQFYSQNQKYPCGSKHFCYWNYKKWILRAQNSPWKILQKNGKNATSYVFAPSTLNFHLIVKCHTIFENRWVEWWCDVWVWINFDEKLWPMRNQHLNIGYPRGHNFWLFLT